jgi:hypothetical protein
VKLSPEPPAQRRHYDGHCGGEVPVPAQREAAPQFGPPPFRHILSLAMLGSHGCVNVMANLVVQNARESQSDDHRQEPLGPSGDVAQSVVDYQPNTRRAATPGPLIPARRICQRNLLVSGPRLLLSFIPRESGPIRQDYTGQSLYVLGRKASKKHLDARPHSGRRREIPVVFVHLNR